MSSLLKVAVAIATTGRRDTVTQVVTALLDQYRRADIVAIAPGKPEDVDRPALARLPIALRYAIGPLGLCAQRNSLLGALPDADIVLFIDDDFLMAPTFIAECEAAFLAMPDVVMVTGQVVADGILGPGLSFEAARAALAGDRAPALAQVDDVYNGYGCNMAVRTAPIRAAGLRFDEMLPAYGWLEDVDFSRQLAEHGRIVRSNRCRGVHMGAKHGRSPGVRLGYSQVANPYYMWRKGTLTAPRAAAQMSRNLIANFVRAAAPEAWVDRRGRARGNLVAIRHVLAGSAHPQHATKLT